MDRQKVLLILPFVVWLALFPLLWYASWVGGPLYYFLSCSVAVYLIAASIVVVKLSENRSAIQRFGIQSGRLLILVLLVLTSVVATLVTTSANWYAFLAVVFSPVPEEIFFRGFILGTFTDGNMSKSLKVVVGSLLLSSLIFSVSHIFRSYFFPDFLGIFLFGLVLGFFYLWTQSILLPAAIHTTWNLLNVKAEYVLSLQSWSLVILIIIPSCLLFAVEWLKKRKISKPGAAVQTV